MSQARNCSTIVASAGVVADPGYRSLTPPLWASDTFGWADPDTKPAFDYSRTANPNRDLLADALARLEGASRGVITNSGQAATLLALLPLPAGALIVAPHDCYGGTYRLLKGLEVQGKLQARFIDQNDDEAFETAMAQKPAMLWIETPSNPLLRIVDIADRAARAREVGALVVADNTLPTPCRQRPLELGCDLVMHSTSKALNGHADLIGGALLAADANLAEQLEWWANAAGLTGSAHDAWQTLRGLRTLPLRIAQQEQTAGKIAQWLSDHDQVEEVLYPGLPSHPDGDLALRQQDGPGFVLSFRLRGGEGVTTAFLSGLRLITLAASLGSFATLICRPSTMTHAGMPPEAQAEAGIDSDLLRLSIGLEETEDLVADLKLGFRSAGQNALGCGNPPVRASNAIGGVDGQDRS